MFGSIRSLCVAVAALFLAAAPGFAADAAKSDGAKKKIVFLAGGPSHKFGAHDAKAGSYLLAKRINEVPGFEAVVCYVPDRDKDWPDAKVFEGASAIISFCDGADKHILIPHMKQIDELNDRGVGIGSIHFSIEIPKGEGGDHWLKWFGGYYETFFSINPKFHAEFPMIPKHPVTSGVRPFATEDEWYYNMRFRPNMEGITPILTTIPPDSTRTIAENDAHRGNPIVKAEVGKNHPEHVMWVTEYKNGSRGFAVTGAHFHVNWAQDDFRKLILNSIIWTAKGEVPASGIESKRPDVEELMQNNDEEIPKTFKKDDWAKQIEEMNKPFVPAAAK
jgi:hypothetical protein